MRKFLLAFFIIFLGQVSHCQLKTLPVARFTFNDGRPVEDITGAPIKAVGVSLVSDRFGNPKSAYYLQGNNFSYLNLGTSKTLKPTTITISIWVKYDYIIHHGSGIKFNPVIITKSNPSDDFFEGYFIGIYMDNRKINVNSATGEEQGVGITSTDTVVMGKWHHLVLAFDDRYMWLYIDGVMQNDNKPMDKNFRSRYLETDSVVIGNTANIKNSRYFMGNVDDIEIYNRVLSADEVYELYNTPDPNKTHRYWQLFYRVLGVLLIIILFIWLSIKRYKIALEKEKEKNRVNLRLIELETKAIRGQMNPHFMFNSLSTLQRFILESDIKGAHLYVSKFSKLLRRILENNASDSISLPEEMDILNGYIEIERMRFNHSFDFYLNSTVASPETCHIPLLLVQPFIENAIWHGLLPLQDKQHLSVEFSSPHEKTVFCVIDDNGVGREHSLQRRDPLKKKSLALELITQRLELLSRSTGTDCGFTIIDKKNDQGESTGTRVELRMPKLNML